MFANTQQNPTKTRYYENPLPRKPQLSSNLCDNANGRELIRLVLTSCQREGYTTGIVRVAGYLVDLHEPTCWGAPRLGHPATQKWERGIEPKANRVVAVSSVIGPPAEPSLE